MIRKCEICGKEFETKGGRYPRLYCDEHLYEERECVVCKKKFTVLRYKDQLTCSCECSNVYYPRHEKKDPVVKICPFCEKEYTSKSNTCSKSCATKLQLQRQGSPFGRKDVQEKSKQTMIERYGVPYAQMNEEIKDKTRESEGAKRTKFKEGQDFKNFWIEKLGVDNPQKNKMIRDKTNKTCQERYNGNAPLCSKKVVSKAYKTLSLNNKNNKFEKEIKNYIKSLDENAEIISNTKDLLINPNTNCKLELDIYLPEYNLAIECMGRYMHDYNKFPEKEERDRLKIVLCKEKGIELIQVWEDNIDEGKQKIKDKLRR